MLPHQLLQFEARGLNHLHSIQNMEGSYENNPNVPGTLTSPLQICLNAPKGNLILKNNHFFMGEVLKLQGVYIY